MGHDLFLDLQSNDSGYALLVVATFDGEGYTNGGYTDQRWFPEAQEWRLDVKAASASPGVTQTTYLVPMGSTHPIPNASQAIVVRLVDEDGEELACKRLQGGGTIGSTDDTDASSKPFPEEELLTK